jgi:tetratricopeptide (TPR) repeat protein
MIRASFLPLAIPLLLLLDGCASSRAGRPEPELGSDPLEKVSAAELYQRGIRFRTAGDFIRAEQYLAAAMDRGYPADKVVPVLIDVCLVSSRTHAALRHARAHLTSHPQDWRLRYLVASLEYTVGNHEAARAEAERLLDEHPEQAEPHYLMALTESNQQRAIDHLRRYLEAQPDGPNAVDARARVRALEAHGP